MRFDLTDLNLFQHIAEAGSITAGAQRAHLALASASARIRGMEDQLGVPLLTRVRHGVTLTPAGLTLSHHARLVLGQMEQLRGELGDYARGLKGHVRLLCNTVALTEFLPALLARFLVENPHINIDLEERLSHDIVQAVVDGQADIGIVADAVDMAGLEQVPFREDQLVVVMPREHVLLEGREQALLERRAHALPMERTHALPMERGGGAAHARGIAFADTLGFDFIGLAGDSALQLYLGEHAARAGRPMSYRIRLRSFEAICRVVGSGAGIGIVPATAARACQRSMPIRSIRLSDSWALRQLTLCVRSRAGLSPHAQRLVAALASPAA